jgi:hypothetical protein
MQHASRGCVENRGGHPKQLLVPFSSRDDPFDLFRGLLFALPTSLLGFWLPLALVFIALRSV